MIERMDNVGIIVDDLDAATEFFVALGLELEGTGQVEGPFADRTTGLDGVRCDIAMVRTPDGNSRLELCTFRSPAAIGETNLPVNTRGIFKLMFAVDDIDATVAGLRARGHELVGEMVQYEDVYRLCYVRGPEGIIVALAQELGKSEEA